jgi:threonine aldolase
MDGARFANALVHLGCSPAEATWKSGVDVLSLGATKNGALCAEAVVFFKPSLALDFDRRRKRGGQLWSKMRFLSAQLIAYLEHDLWLVNARQANAMAQRLAGGFAGIPGARLLQPVQANEAFVALPERTVAALEQAGFGFYRWPLALLEDAVAIRLVTSYATQPGDVDALLTAAAR